MSKHIQRLVEPNYRVYRGTRPVYKAKRRKHPWVITMTVEEAFTWLLCAVVLGFLGSLYLLKF